MINRFAAGLVALVAALGLGAVAPAHAAPAPAVPIAVRASLPNPPKPSPADRVVNPNPTNRDKQLPGTVKSGPIKSSSLAALTTFYYSYAIAEDNQASTGMQADAQITRPWLSSADRHTLWEMSMCDDVNSATRNCFEIGWTIDNSGSTDINGTDTVNPHLFVSYWKGGEFQGWNGGPDYHDWNANTTIYPKISLNGAVGGTRYFRMQYFDDAVWFGYGTGTGGSTWFDWIGYVDVINWGALKPTTFGTNQWFGEIASTTRAASLQCTDMLTNVTPTTTAGHLTSGMDLYSNASPDDISVRVAPVITGRGAVKVSSSSAREGGPGPC